MRKDSFPRKNFRSVKSIPQFLLFYDARVKSLKPRCACTGVVLRLSDPPDMSIKVER